MADEGIVDPSVGAEGTPVAPLKHGGRHHKLSGRGKSAANGTLHNNMFDNICARDAEDEAADAAFVEAADAARAAEAPPTE